MRLHEMTDQHLAQLAALTVQDMINGTCDAAALNPIRDEAIRRAVVARTWKPSQRRGTDLAALARDILFAPYR